MARKLSYWGFIPGRAERGRPRPSSSPTTTMFGLGSTFAIQSDARCAGSQAHRTLRDTVACWFGGWDATTALGRGFIVSGPVSEGRLRRWRTTTVSASTGPSTGQHQALDSRTRLDASPRRGLTMDGEPRNTRDRLVRGSYRAAVSFNFSLCFAVSRQPLRVATCHPNPPRQLMAGVTNIVRFTCGV